jgi:hypothetical protein
VGTGSSHVNRIPEQKKKKKGEKVRCHQILQWWPTPATLTSPPPPRPHPHHAAMPHDAIITSRASCSQQRCGRSEGCGWTRVATSSLGRVAREFNWTRTEQRGHACCLGGEAQPGDLLGHGTHMEIHDDGHRNACCQHHGHHAGEGQAQAARAARDTTACPCPVGHGPCWSMVGNGAVCGFGMSRTRFCTKRKGSDGLLPIDSSHTHYSSCCWHYRCCW